MHRSVNVASGTVQDRELTEHELASYAAVAAAVEQREQQRAAEEAERAAVEAAHSAAARLAVVDKLDDLPDHTVSEVAPLFPAWRQPEGAHDAWPEGVIVRHDGALWRSTTAANVWPPGESGWHRYGAAPDAGPQPWVTPTGAHDAYPLGAIVTHNGQTWESTHDSNVWEPGVSGWVVVVTV